MIPCPEVNLELLENAHDGGVTPIEVVLVHIIKRMPLYIQISSVFLFKKTHLSEKLRVDHLKKSTIFTSSLFFKRATESVSYYIIQMYSRLHYTNILVFLQVDYIIQIS